ncbi:MAG: Ig-like domain-containing protein [Chitinophagales bacterium]|nr:Ig-like domain-containing protein [Chitinophagales bacterium]
MKKQKWSLITMVAMAIVLTAIMSCKKDNNNTAEFTLTGITANGTDLNGSSSATGVDPNSIFIVTFSTNVDASTVNSSNITLIRQSDDSTIATSTSTTGNTIRITPSTNLGSGNLYTLTLGAGIKSTDGVSFVQTTRTFTTLGAYAPVGEVAYWNFEGNANDASGNGYNASASIAVNYVAGRNTTAGQAASFDGSTSIIEIPGGPALENTSTFTLSFWINGDTLGHRSSDSIPFLKGNFVMGAGFFRGFEIECGATFNFCKFGASYAVTGAPTPTVANDFYVDGNGEDASHGGWQGILSEADLSSQGGFTGLLVGKWANIVITFDASTEIRKMYVNGALTETDDLHLWPAGDPLQTATGLEFEPNATDLGTDFVFGFAADRTTTFWNDTPFGNYASPNANHFKGLLDDVRIYHKVITDAEIAQMYSSGK